jgi:hypothetical protein
VRTSETKIATARMLATAGTNKEGTQTKGMTQAITVTPTDEMTKTGLKPTSHDFSRGFAKNSRELQKFVEKNTKKKMK